MGEADLRALKKAGGVEAVSEALTEAIEKLGLKQVMARLAEG